MISLGVGFFFFILIGVPVAFVFGLAALTVVVMTDLPLVIIAHQFFTGLNNFTLMAISFFLLTGMLMEEGGSRGASPTSPSISSAGSPAACCRSRSSPRRSSPRCRDRAARTPPPSPRRCCPR
jgi:hypothetical protein